MSSTKKFRLRKMEDLQDKNNETKPHGFARKLQAEKIVGCTTCNGELMFLIKW